MTPRWMLLIALASTQVWADIPPQDTAGCRNALAGAACITDTGGAGTCVEEMVSRPDYSGGVPPKFVQVKTLRCNAEIASTQKNTASFTVLAAALLAMLGYGLRRRLGRREFARA